MNLGRPRDVARVLMEERVGRRRFPDNIRVLCAPPEFRQIVGQSQDTGRQGCPVSEFDRGCEFTREVDRCDPPQSSPQLEMVPRIPARIRDYAKIDTPCGVGEEGETAVGKDRAWSQYAPGAQGHGGGANPEDRTGSFAKEKSGGRVHVFSQLLQALKNFRPGLPGGGNPEGRLVATQPSDRHADGGGVDQ